MRQLQRYKMIINPKSGSNLRVRSLKMLRDHLLQRGDEVVISLTRSLEHAAELTCKAIAEKFDVIMIAGGDGSVRTVLEAAAGSEVPILIIPTGTENLLACELGLDGSVKTSISALDSGKVRKIDLGRVNGRHFIAVVGLGFDAQVVKYVHHKRSGHITPLDYLWPLARTFWSYKFVSLHIIADGKDICDQPALAYVSNIGRYAIGIGIAPEADCGDGYLDLTVFRCKNRWQLLLQSIYTILKADHRLKTTTRVRCKNIRIEGPETVPVQIDGDYGPSLPLDFTIDSGFAHILTPPAVSGQEYCPPVRYYHIKRWLLR
ncbi:MAG: NAD(+)/NADH kinase [Sedimentisphaerales bacterium]|nr:NAD(+)/NADH kinase [Sedimentisphaerales bacterium]MBN2843652.1 NAD(+)/NADH kinase [Sedimentisphaerales bacterium]